VLLTYGLILIFEEVRSLLVGDEVHGVDIPAVFSASIQLSDVLSYPVYRLVISAVCIVLAVALYFVIQRTRLGMMIRAGNHDRVMVEALGININMIYRVVFALGVALAALAGMLAAPISSVFPNMGSHVLIISFVIVVIGGIGSVWGALVAALVIGFADTFGKVLVPELSGWSSIWSWPRCCCGGPKASSRKVEAMKLDTSWSSSCWRCRLACVPLAGADFYTELIAKTLVMAIFAMSLDLLVGFTGLVSFGHAAYFGVAAYAVALLSPKYEAASLWYVLPASVGLAALAALVVGSSCCAPRASTSSW
jgi:branched-subunit amino acid ABC-type transport system permease component